MSSDHGSSRTSIVNYFIHTCECIKEEFEK